MGPTAVSDGGNSSNLDSSCSCFLSALNPATPVDPSARLLTSRSFFLAAKGFEGVSSGFGAAGDAAALVNRRVETASISPETDVYFGDGDEVAVEAEAGGGEGFGAGAVEAEEIGAAEFELSREAEGALEGLVDCGVERAARRRSVRESVDFGAEGGDLEVEGGNLVVAAADGMNLVFSA